MQTDPILDLLAMLDDAAIVARKSKLFGNKTERIEPPIVAEWHYRDFACQIKLIPIDHHDVFGHYCGYAKAANPATPVMSREDAEQVEVHGGVTYFHDGEYGFDCAHWDDLHASAKCRQLEWVKRETQRMVDNIIDTLMWEYDYDPE